MVIYLAADMQASPIVQIDNNGGGLNAAPLQNNQHNEPANIALGGFTQRSSRVVVEDSGNPSDLILTNFRIASTGAGSTATKRIVGSNFTQPAPLAVSAWHRLVGSVSLPGPIDPGNWAMISLVGLLDGQTTSVPTTCPATVNPTGFSVKVTKNADQVQFPFDCISPVYTMNPKTAPLHTRDITYTFTMGPTSVAGAEIRLPNSGDNPFVGEIPEPGTNLLLGCGLIAISLAWRIRRKAAFQDRKADIVPSKLPASNTPEINGLNF
jgi:hypothetical protein